MSEHKKQYSLILETSDQWGKLHVLFASRIAVSLFQYPQACRLFLFFLSEAVKGRPGFVTWVNVSRDELGVKFDMHPREMSRALSILISERFLVRHKLRSTLYCIPTVLFSMGREKLEVCTSQLPREVDVRYIGTVKKPKPRKRLVATELEISKK
jgi:hypothetical protein